MPIILASILTPDERPRLETALREMMLEGQATSCEQTHICKVGGGRPHLASGATVMGLNARDGPRAGAVTEAGLHGHGDGQATRASPGRGGVHHHMLRHVPAAHASQRQQEVCSGRAPSGAPRWAGE